MAQAEENLTNDFLMKILEVIEVDQNEFQQNTMYHSQTQEKVMAIMAIQKKSSGNMPVLDKAKCMEVFKVQ